MQRKIFALRLRCKHTSIVKRLHNDKMFNISLHIYVCCEGKDCKETILNTAAKAASEVIIEVLVEYMVRIKTHINEHGILSLIYLPICLIVVL